MAPAPRNAFAAKVLGSSKGKENELPPSTTTATAIVKKCKEVPLRRHASLSSNDERRTELAGSIGLKGLAIAETLSSRKTPFHVHCDDKNAPQPKPQPQVRPRRGSTTTSKPLASFPDHRNENIQPAPGVEETGDRLSRKRLPEDRSRKNENLLPSKIPRRVRSISIGSGQQKPRSCGDGNALPRRAISIARSSSTAVERTATAKSALRDQTYRVEPSGRVVTPTTVQGNGFEERIDTNDLQAWLRNGHRPVVSSSASVRSPKTFTANLCETPKQQPPVGASEARPTSFPGQLLWNTAYHTDLLMIEREKEERESRLSINFLREHVNTEQRTLIVTFLLRLGTYSKYPSNIIYRAVKLFDAVVDKLRLDTAFIQLAALASLWIALKTLENFSRVPTATKMISLAKDLYAGREDLLIDYEKKILRILNFNVIFADVHSLFGYHLINCKYCAHLSEEMFAFVYRAGGYAIDVTLLDERFCRMSASLIAITAAELVLGVVVDTEQARTADRPTEIQPRWLFWRGLLYGAAATVGSRFGYRFQDEEIDRCRVMMLRCILSSGKKNTIFTVVWRKYNRSRYGRIVEPFLERASMLSLLESFES